MDTLKKYFPVAFNAKNDVTALVINIIIHVIAMAIVGAVSWLLGFIPLLGAVLGVICGLIGLYLLISLVLSILDYLKILK